MKITAFSEAYTLGVAATGDALASADGSNGRFAGDVTGEAIDLSVVGIRRQVSIASNLSPMAIGDALTIVQTTPSVVARFATPSNTAGVGTFTALGWFNVEDYGAVHDGVTDDTAAIQAAINACMTAGGGTVYFPSDGSGYTDYLIAGALQSTTTYNSQLKIPTAASWTYIRFLGAKRFSVDLVSNWSGAISGNPAIIAAGKHKAVIGDATYNPVYVMFEDIRIVAPDNPKLSAVCMCAAISCYGMGVDLAVTAFPATLPTNSNVVGVCFPWGLNDGHSGGQWLISGYYSGARPSEQFNGDFWIYFSVNALWFEGQTGSPALLRHACRIGRAEVFYNTQGILFSGDERWVWIDQLCLEHDDPGYTTTVDINDPSNYGRGFIGWHTTDYATGPEDNLTVSGGTGLSLHGGYAKRWKLTNVVDIPTGTDPSTNPATGRRMYAASATGKLTVRKPDGSTVDLEAAALTAATSVTSETTAGITPAVGTSTNYARQDHTHGSPAASASGQILVSDTPAGSPLVFADLLQNEAGTDLLYAD